jgi:hypothetical protein
LRPGYVHSAEGWGELLLPEIERPQKLGKDVVFRADAAFDKPEIYEPLGERGVKYAIRIAANGNLERDINELLTPGVPFWRAVPSRRIHRDDAAELPPLPVKQGALVVERDSLHLGPRVLRGFG